MMTESIHMKTFLSGATIGQKMETVEAEIRSNPDKFQYRWQLFLLLCLQGNWERAIQQLQLCAKFDAQFSKEAQALRWLIKCEHLREEIFSTATKKPPFWEGKESPWMSLMFDALKLNLEHETDLADQIRNQALDQSSQETTGQINGEPFMWLTDSDSRLGPICELYHNQNYWWISLSDIKQINFYKPQTTIDLIWAKGQFLLKDQTTFMAYTPARYPLNSQPENDNILLSQYTSWQEEGETLVIASGQKVFATEEKDYPLLECQEIIFD